MSHLLHLYFIFYSQKKKSFTNQPSFYCISESSNEYMPEEYIIEETIGKIYLPVNFDSDGIKILEIDDESVKIWDDKIQILRQDNASTNIVQDLTNDPQLTITESVNNVSNTPITVFTSGQSMIMPGQVNLKSDFVNSSVNTIDTSVVEDNVFVTKMVTGKNGQLKVRRIPSHMQPKQGLGERYPCPGCKSTYSQRKNLQRHLRLECGQEPKFPCPYCQLRCKRNNQLQHHIVTKHQSALQEGKGGEMKGEFE